MKSFNIPLRFNPKNTFDTFVVSRGNNLTFAAAKAVADTPGEAYNPLLLVGGTGLGKTHLLHAIGNHVSGHQKRSRQKRLKVGYYSAEGFTNEYIKYIQANQIKKFREQCRQNDLLLIDDIQSLAGRERIQEELFHTFNTLQAAQKQIVLTCARPLSEIHGMEHRLVSRFEWGLVIKIQPPDMATRVAILQEKARAMDFVLPENIIRFLAQRIHTNVRRLEGALIRVASNAKLTGKTPTIKTVESLLRAILPEPGRHYCLYG